LLSYNSTSHRYNTTEKGLRFLNLCHKMDDMINKEQQQQQHLQSLSSLSKRQQQSWMKSEVGEMDL
jgi:hypothetical protein